MLLFKLVITKNYANETQSIIYPFSIEEEVELNEDPWDDAFYERPLKKNRLKKQEKGIDLWDLFMIWINEEIGKLENFNLFSSLAEITHYISIGYDGNKIALKNLLNFNLSIMNLFNVFFNCSYLTNNIKMFDNNFRLQWGFNLLCFSLGVGSGVFFNLLPKNIIDRVWRLEVEKKIFDLTNKKSFDLTNYFSQPFLFPFCENKAIKSINLHYRDELFLFLGVVKQPQHQNFFCYFVCNPFEFLDYHFTFLKLFKNNLLFLNYMEFSHSHELNVKIYLDLAFVDNTLILSIQKNPYDYLKINLYVDIFKIIFVFSWVKFFSKITQYLKFQIHTNYLEEDLFLKLYLTICFESFQLIFSINEQGEIAFFFSFNDVKEKVLNK